MDSASSRWPSLTFEELPWHRDLDEPRFLSKTARQKIGSTYRAAIPFTIGKRSLVMPPQLAARIEEVTGLLSRFDETQQQRGYDLPALLLRSESAASSQIENLTSSARNIALAELTSDAPHNAQIIAGNIAAMREALSGDGELSIEAVLAIHKVLIDRTGQSFGGELRDEQVWIGGSAYSPHGATYVPPHAGRVRGYLEDIIAFAHRDDVGAIAKAALVHAQFETVHPFIDGNGRTGRTLLHRILKQGGVLGRVTLPVSAGLLHNIDQYLESITRYQEGDPLPVIEELLDALEFALALGEMVAHMVDKVLADWEDRITERAGSSMHRLPALLVQHPVVNVAFLAGELEITPRAAQNLVARACEYNMLRAFGNKRRGTFYQADDIIDILEQASSVQGVRRLIAGKPCGKGW